MAQDSSTPARRRRFPGWLIVVLVLVILLAVGALWLFGPRIRAALAPEATLPPQVSDNTPGGVLYETTFDTLESFADWEVFNDGAIAAEPGSGQLVVSINALTDTGTWSGLNYTFDDFSLSVDATKLDGPDDNGITIVFRLTDTSNYNRFDISSDGFYSLSMVRGGQPAIVSDWTRSDAILTGAATNRITVTGVGDTFRFAVNGTPLPLCISTDPASQALWDPFASEPTCLGGNVVDAWPNADLPRGKLGLGAQGFSGFDGEAETPAVAMIGFDNLVITAPGG